MYSGYVRPGYVCIEVSRFLKYNYSFVSCNEQICKTWLLSIHVANQYGCYISGRFLYGVYLVVDGS